MGAGLIHLGVAAGSDPLVLAALVLVGAAEAGWGVAALARPAVPILRAALIVAVLLVAGWIAVLLTSGGGHQHGAVGAASGTAELPVGAMSGAAALDLLLALVLAVAHRRGTAGLAEEGGPWRFLVMTAAGAGLVAVAVSTSLAGVFTGGAHLH